MHPRDWKRFLEIGEGKEIAIAQLSLEMTQFLGAKSEKVYLHHTYAVKSAQKHGLTPERFPLIFDVIERGAAISDYPSHVTFFHFDPESQRWYQATVKCPQDSKRVYIVTFHRVNARKVTNRMARYPTLRK